MHPTIRSHRGARDPTALSLGWHSFEARITLCTSESVIQSCCSACIVWISGTFSKDFQISCWYIAVFSWSTSPTIRLLWPVHRLHKIILPYPAAITRVNFSWPGPGCRKLQLLTFTFVCLDPRLQSNPHPNTNPLALTCRPNKRSKASRRLRQQ